jgi:hypothetical protein
MFVKYVVKVLILPEIKVVAVMCKCSALKLKKVVRTLSYFYDKIN